ncbi:unknown [Clostridium sp. CAG:448]|nr:unknown [Clostridium sp. CAG:448]
MQKEKIAASDVIFLQNDFSEPRQPLQFAGHGDGSCVEHKSGEKNGIDDCQPAGAVEDLFCQDACVGTAENKDIVSLADGCCKFFCDRKNCFFLCFPCVMQCFFHSFQISVAVHGDSSVSFLNGVLPE